jgi:hypothetical protein
MVAVHMPQAIWPRHFILATVEKPTSALLNTKWINTVEAFTDSIALDMMTK